MNQLIITFLSIIPIFALILFGHILNRCNFPGPSFWPASEKLTYYVLLPALLVHGLSSKDVTPEMQPLILGLIFSLLTMSLLMLFSKPLQTYSDASFTSVFQGSIRPNTYIGLSLASSFLGPDWMSLSAVALLTLIPIVNILCVLILSRYGNKNNNSIKTLLIELIKNPLLMACVIGISINLLNLSIPELLMTTIEIPGQAALPIGLMAVGAGLQFKNIKKAVSPIAISTVNHLLLLPFLGFYLVSFMGGQIIHQKTAVIFTAIPVSVSSFILARQMGGDHKIMAKIITAQTILALITIPLILSLLNIS